MVGRAAAAGQVFLPRVGIAPHAPPQLGGGVPPREDLGTWLEGISAQFDANTAQLEAMLAGTANTPRHSAEAQAHAAAADVVNRTTAELAEIEALRRKHEELLQSEELRAVWKEVDREIDGQTGFKQSGIHYLCSTEAQLAKWNFWLDIATQHGLE